MKTYEISVVYRDEDGRKLSEVFLAYEEDYERTNGVAGELADLFVEVAIRLLYFDSWRVKCVLAFLESMREYAEADDFLVEFDQALAGFLEKNDE